jgi:hypothetical protein
MIREGAGAGNTATYGSQVDSQAIRPIRELARNPTCTIKPANRQKKPRQRNSAPMAFGSEIDEPARGEL